MAYELIWSPAARNDLHDIVVFIARNNPKRAVSFGYELISETERLQAFPELGRTVPEYRNDNIREMILRPFESCTDLIRRTSGVRSFAFGIQHVEKLADAII
jgi:plasmid stabilization system protein ParE